MTLSAQQNHSVNDRRLHFGLGAAKEVDIEVKWPRGKVQTFRKVTAGRVVSIREDQGVVN